MWVCWWGIGGFEIDWWALVVRVFGNLSLISSGWTIYSIFGRHQVISLLVKWRTKICRATKKMSQNIILKLKISWRIVGLCSNAPIIWNPWKACLGESSNNHLIFTNVWFPGGEDNTCFHFFIVWFSESLKSSRGVSEWTTSSHPQIRRTSWWMSGGFIFDFSVITILGHLVI